MIVHENTHKYDNLTRLAKMVSLHMCTGLGNFPLLKLVTEEWEVTMCIYLNRNQLSIYRIVQLCGRENIGEFGEFGELGKLTTIRQRFTYQYFLYPNIFNRRLLYSFILERVLVLSDCCYTCSLKYC